MLFTESNSYTEEPQSKGRIYLFVGLVAVAIVNMINMYFLLF